MLELNKIYCMNALEGFKQIDDSSIDMILTDPPYPREFNHLYGELAKNAKRILKDGSYLFAYAGGDNLNIIIEDMSKHLDWFWMFGIKHNGGNPRVWSKKIMVGFKPVLVFTKGKPKKVEWMCNLHSSESSDKRFHEWGQDVGFSIKTIEILTQEQDVILDPFIGGGTTAMACKQTNRNFIGFEIDQKHVDIANKRLSQKTLTEVCGEDTRNSSQD